MDSEDEDEDNGKEGEAKEEDEKEQDSVEKEPEDEPVTAEILDQVHSFGRMMILAESLQKRLRNGTLNAQEVTAACRALGRTKFFDGDMLEDLQAVLRKLMLSDNLDAQQTNDAIVCFRTLNAYDKTFFSAVARAFKGKTREMQAPMRHDWMEVFKGFNHNAEPDFLQLLEVPPLLANNPSYRKVRCWHFSRGSCLLEAQCTYSHDPRAPLSLADGGIEDWWRSKPLVMTQNQKTLGHGVYGLSSQTDTRAPPVAPAGWLMMPQVQQLGQ